MTFSVPTSLCHKDPTHTKKTCFPHPPPLLPPYFSSCSFPWPPLPLLPWVASVTLHPRILAFPGLLVETLTKSLRGVTRLSRGTYVVMMALKFAKRAWFVTMFTCQAYSCWPEIKLIVWKSSVCPFWVAVMT